jgi:hypothetical protein
MSAFEPEFVDGVYELVWFSVIIKMNRSLEQIRRCLGPLPKSFKGCSRPGDEEDATVILVNLIGELWPACELWYFQLPIKISAWALWWIFWDIGLTFVCGFHLSSSIGKVIPVDDFFIKIRHKYKVLSWRSQTETKTEMVVNSVPSVSYIQTLPGLRQSLSLITKNWDSLQFLVMSDENGLKSWWFWSQETKWPEFVVIEIIFWWLHT